MKRKTAKAAFDMIEDGMVLGLGGGKTVSMIIDLLKENPRKISAVSPSEDTLASLLEAGIPVLPLSTVERVDLAFDGCDELDFALNALKSAGGIHTREKIVASMAGRYILLADEGKFHQTLPFEHPVTVEVIPAAHASARRALEALGADVRDRRFPGKSGTAVSDDGNYLVEARVRPQDPEALCEKIKKIPGVVDSSLFAGVAHGALIAGESGVRLVWKRELREVS